MASSSHYWNVFSVSALLLSGLALASSCAAQTGTGDQGNLLPNLDNPKMQFGTGRVVNNKPEMSPVLPDLPGDTSRWTINEFTPIQLVSADRMTRNDPATSDPVFGPAAYAFDAPDRHAHVWIYKNPASGHLVYELFESGGALEAGGGRDILLSAGVNKPFPTFDHQLTFSMKAKISRAHERYDTPAAMTNGAVLAQVGMAFVLEMPSPVNGTASTVYLQVTLSHSGKRALKGLAGLAPFQASCTVFDNGALEMMTVGTLDGTAMLPFTVDTGPLHEITLNLNDYLTRLTRTPMSCTNKASGTKSVSFQNLDLSKVVLKSAFIGPETEIANHRKGSPNTADQGEASLGIQVSNLRLIESR